ncbi:MAG: FAD:protein FMN transferase, partial [Sphingobacterium sp.]
KLQNLPDSIMISSTLKRVGMDKLKIRGKKLIKIINGVEIDLNGIAQGYTVDVLHNFLLEKNIENFIVEVGGEIRSHGKKPGNESFKVLVQRPESGLENATFVVELLNKSITTSGSYENYRKVENYKFSHHMDPKTGYPLQSKIISVTVIADQAIDADAYDNVFMAMEPQEALSFANSKNIMDIYLLYLEDGIVKEAFSNGFKKYLLTD